MAAELEKLLKRVLQRILCLKHMLEILLHYFFKHNKYSIFVVASPEDPQKAPASHLTTSGPSVFKGPLGKCLNDIPTGHSFWTEDIVEFTPIEGSRCPSSRTQSSQSSPTMSSTSTSYYGSSPSAAKRAFQGLLTTPWVVTWP